MALNDVYEVTLAYSLKGEKCANVFHVREVTDPGSDNEIHIADQVKVDIWDNAIKLAVSQDITLQQIRVRKIHPALGGPVILVVDAAGQVAADVLPSQSCVVIRLYSDLAEKKGRGRMFIPGIPKPYVQDGILLETYRGAYNTIASALIAQFTNSGGDWEPCIFSHVDDTPRDIVLGNTVATLATLRGRRMAAP